MQGLEQEKAIRERQVPDWSGRLSQEILAMAKIIEAIEERLQPVAIIAPPITMQAGQRPTPVEDSLVPLASSIREHCREIERLRDRLQSLLHRVEV